MIKAVFIQIHFILKIELLAVKACVHSGDTLYVSSVQFWEFINCLRTLQGRVQEALALTVTGH